MSHFFKQYQLFFQHSALLLLISITIPSVMASESSINESVFVSADEKTTVIELYTSEGCSSCPPADAWLTRLRNDPNLFRSVIPLAFHVDYWNYLGWKDPFATAKNSHRQRQHQQQGHSNAVYTPGFVIDGKEWRGFFNPLRRSNPPKASNKGEPHPGKLILTRQNSHLTLNFKPLERLGHRQNLVANFVYIGTDLEMPIRSGENRGKTLIHNFVVLSHSTSKAQPNSDQQISYDWQIETKAPQNATAVVAWISATNDLSPIQAVGGWL